MFIQKQSHVAIKTLCCSSLPYYLTIIVIAGGGYLASLLPGVGYSGDTAKFQFIGKVLGTPHATGYPLYIMLNHLFVSIFPIGSLAYRANLLSAVFAVGAVCVLFFIFQRLRVHSLIALFTCIMFAFTPIFWSQSIIAEVYSLHALMMLLTLSFLILWYIDKKDKYLLIGLVVYAIAFGNHMSSILLAPGIGLFVLVTKWQVLCDWKKVLFVCVVIICSSLQYGYLFWRYYDPSTQFIEMQVPNLSTFLWYLKGAQFRNLMFAFPWPDIIQVRIPMFWQLIFDQYHLLVVLGIIGLFVFKQYKVSLLLMVYFVCNAVYGINYKIPDIEPYFIPNFIVIVIYMGIGLNFLWQRISLKIPEKSLLLIAIVPLFFLFLNFDSISQHQNVTIDNDIKKAFEFVGKDALIISPNYHYSCYFWYYLIGEKVGSPRNIYLLHHFNDGKVCRYLNEKETIYLPEQRINILPSLKVYFFLPRESNYREAVKEIIFKLSQQNLKIIKCSDQLVLIQSCGTS